MCIHMHYAYTHLSLSLSLSLYIYIHMHVVALIAQWLGCQPQEAEVLGSILTTSK